MAPKSATKKPAATKTPAEGQTASKTPKAAKTPKVGADGKPAKAKRHAQKLPAPSLFSFCFQRCCVCQIAMDMYVDSRML